MTISIETWVRYKDKLARISSKAVEEMEKFVQAIGGYGDHVEEVLDYAYALSSKYGEAAAELACEMYDAVAVASGLTIPPAEPAATATYGEVAKAIQGAAKTSEFIIPQVTGRMVKQAGQDTTVQNAVRDGAQVAWIPSGDTCAFCYALASRGWETASKDTIKNGHAEHIHANCDCAYAVRFNNDFEIAGYNPNKYKRMYEKADGDTPQEKINSMRREIREKNKDKINAQKREAYAKRAYNSEDEKVLTNSLSFNYTGSPEFIPMNTVIEKPYAMAGGGTGKEIRDIERLVAIYGKDAEEWKKMAGTVKSDKYQFDIHWYECNDGIVREPKIKHMKERK